MSDKRLAVIGLDTSHTVEFTKRMQSSDPKERIVDGMRVEKALRFPSVFQAEDGQDQRQAALEAMGVTLCATIEEAVDGADGVLIEINDPALHLQYFEPVVGLGVPVFIDKPLAGSLEDGRRILELADNHGTPVWSASSLRFIPSLAAAKQVVSSPVACQTFGALGKAAAGSDLVWYGVHAVEMLTAALGAGAESVRAIDHGRAVVLIVRYGDDRRGVVECQRDLYVYGGRLQSKEQVAFFDSTSGSPYDSLLAALRGFFVDGVLPVPLTDAFEILSILVAAENSLASGEEEPLS